MLVSIKALCEGMERRSTFSLNVKGRFSVSSGYKKIGASWQKRDKSLPEHATIFFLINSTQPISTKNLALGILYNSTHHNCYIISKLLVKCNVFDAHLNLVNREARVDRREHYEWDDGIRMNVGAPCFPAQYTDVRKMSKFKAWVKVVTGAAGFS